MPANAAPPSESPAARRLKFFEQGSAPHSPNTPASHGPDAVPLKPLPSTPEQSWRDSLEPLPNGGWQYFTNSGAGSGESVVYVSTHDVTVKGHIVTAWFGWEFMSNQSNSMYQTYRSFVERTEMDCATDTTRDLAATYYASSNLDGASTSQVADPSSAQWAPAVPGTIGELMVEWGCTQIRAIRRR